MTGWTGFSGNMAPLVHDGMVIVGVTGAGYGLHLEGKDGSPISVIGMAGAKFGLRAFLSAYDAATGKTRWRWYATAEGKWEGDFVTFAGAIYGASINAQLLRTDEEIRHHFPEWPAIDPKRRSIVAG